MDECHMDQEVNQTPVCEEFQKFSSPKKLFFVFQISFFFLLTIGKFLNFILNCSNALKPDFSIIAEGLFRQHKKFSLESPVPNRLIYARRKRRRMKRR